MRLTVQIIVRGVGDIGSAVARHLFREGHAVVLHDVPMPTATRRGMAFIDAVFDGHALLEGVHAVRAHDLKRVHEALTAHRAIPVYVRDLDGLLGTVRVDALVDARMRPGAVPEVQRGMARLTIGIGPGFTAGETTNLVVESAPGERLGRVLTQGTSLFDELDRGGEPGGDGHVYAPGDGLFRTRAKIGDIVARDQVVAQLEAVSLRAPLDGVLYGLTRDGVPVTKGTEVIEVDPRGTEADARAIGERARRIADGVVAALRLLTA
jgi:xanthine dehydrogenase accessory factor